MKTVTLPADRHGFFFGQRRRSSGLVLACPFVSVLYICLCPVLLFVHTLSRSLSNTEPPSAQPRVHGPMKLVIRNRT